MFHIFGNIKSLFKIQSVCIDNHVFRLHYQVTLIALIICSSIVNSRQYFGDPIDCTSNAENAHIMDNYCWLHSFITTGPFEDVRLSPLLVIREQTERVYQGYYQWVGFVLFFQAFLFYIPRYLWKFVWEGGKVKGLTSGMKGPFVDKETQKSKTQFILDYFSEQSGSHGFYFLCFAFCELLNLLNVLIQLYLMNAFLGDEFSTYGIDVLSLVHQLPEARNDPMNRIFPKIVKCQFTKVGDAGFARPFDSICVLPINIFNEKIYIFLWFWLNGLAILSALALFYRAATVAFAPARIYMLIRKSRCRNTVAVRRMLRKGGLGDWFLWYQLAKNVDPLIFGDLLQECAERLGGIPIELSNRLIRKDCP